MELHESRVFLAAVPVLLIAPAIVVPTIVSGNENSAAENTSLEQIVQNPESFQGEKVTVNGTANARIICTQMACRPENQCCNSCTGDLFLESANYSINLDFKNSSGSCSGNNCNVDCQPLEKDKKYRLKGIIGKSNNESVLNVTEHRQL